MHATIELNHVESTVRRFFQEDQAQDLIEYTLLLAFICIATAALFVSSGGSLSGIWSSANSDLAAANTSAS
jgi:Flp pilus assembly pilin Flp